MQAFLAPTCVDLVRFRNVDFSSIMYEILAGAAIRMDFIKNVHAISRETIHESTSSIAKALLKNGNIDKVIELG